MHGASRLGAQTRQLGINWQTNYLSLPELYAAFENVVKSIFVNAARGSKEFHSKQWILSQSIDTQVRFVSKPVWTSIQTLYSLISLATKDTCGVTLWMVFCVFSASSAARTCTPGSNRISLWESYSNEFGDLQITVRRNFFRAPCYW